ncbi:MAG: hypothetical protein HQK91_11115 [Nitrospirae bacterium]|nr:hypothetical protein [Nitrospirota bacterium]
MLNISSLRDIGSALLKIVPKYRFASNSREALRTGAAGDSTFPFDKACEDIILSMLDDSKEPLSIISEENGYSEINGGGRRVIIDPLDGSRNATTGIPFFCTSIAAADGDTIGDINLCYIINLISGDEFWAEKDSGAFLNEGRIFTSKSEKIEVVLYETHNTTKDMQRLLPLFKQSHRIRCFGTIAMDLSYLSMGAASIAINPSKSRTFDFGGGWLLVKEAGGIFTDTNGSDISKVKLGLGHETNYIASANITIHQKALELLNKI